MPFENAVVLLVEDNPGDARLTKEALIDGKVKLDLFHVEDGAQALAFLKGEGEYADSPLPDLILLDLNLPTVSGHEVLADIRKNPKTSNIPVVILTTSKDEIDIAKSYDLRANCYVSKPVDFESFVEVIKAIDEFWCPFYPNI